MMEQRPFDMITIGGSAGSLPVLLNILGSIPAHFCVPVVLVLHRMRNVYSEMNKVLSINKHISEPEDKEGIKECCIYLAPQNYHLLVEEDYTFSLDYSEPVNYSRPSIDVSFSSLAEVYKDRLLGVLLSGANKDGAEGLHNIIAAGGKGIVQDPATASYPAMPQAAIDLDKRNIKLSPEKIAQYITTIIA